MPRTLIGEFVSRPPDHATAPGLDHLTAKTRISRAMTRLGARDGT